MKKLFTIYGALIIIFLIMSTSLAIPQIHTRCSIVQVKKQNNIMFRDKTINSNSSNIDFILRLLNFLQNVCTIVIGKLNPFMNPLNKIAEFFGNILEKIKPWEELGIAILNLIDAIDNLLNNGENHLIN